MLTSSHTKGGDMDAHEPNSSTHGQSPSRTWRDPPRADTRRVNEFVTPSVSQPEVEAVTTEELAPHSPDGRPADQPSRSRGRTALYILLGVGLPIVLTTVLFVGGPAALGMSLVYAGILAFVA